MRIHNTDTYYGIIAKSFHWIIAILIIAAWIVGDYAVDLPFQSPAKSMLYGLHKSTGMLILMLATARLTWRLYDGAPKVTDINKVFMTAAITVHYLLYLFMFIQPLSGWAMSSAAGYTPNFYGLFTFPSLVAKNPVTLRFYQFLHDTFAQQLLALFILHVSGSLFHYFVLKDRTLQRITVD